MTFRGYTSKLRDVLTVEFDAIDLELFIPGFALLFLTSIYRGMDSFLLGLFTIYKF